MAALVVALVLALAGGPAPADVVPPRPVTPLAFEYPEAAALQPVAPAGRQPAVDAPRHGRRADVVPERHRGGGLVSQHRRVAPRTGAAAGATDFDEQLWLRLMKVIE